MRKLICSVAVGIGLTVFGPAAPAAENAQVSMVDNEPDLTRWHFDPAEITVPAGATVVWVNKGKEEHTVTADDKSFDSGMKRSGQTFQRAFPKPGRYSYYCAPHPWMKGAVRVLPGATAAAGRTASEASSPTTTATVPATVSTAPPTTISAPTPAPTTAPPPAAETPPAGNGAGDSDDRDNVAAGPDGSGDDGRGLPGTLAIVLVPTLAGLALGAKLRQRSASTSA